MSSTIEKITIAAAFFGSVGGLLVGMELEDYLDNYISGSLGEDKLVSTGIYIGSMVTGAAFSIGVTTLVAALHASRWNWRTCCSNNVAETRSIIAQSV